MRGRIRCAVAGSVLATALLPACSINPQLRLGESLPQSGALLVEDVPFHPQTDHDCGPAALATLLGASGVATTPESLVPQVFLPGRRGSLQLELMGASRRAGRIPYPVERTPDALLDELQAGRPVLVLQNLLVRTVPKWHYAVLVGADPVRNRMILNSGTRRALPVRAPSFLRTWDWAGRWAIVTLRPGEMPAHPDPATYMVAVADFEAVAGAPAAIPAWRAAMQRWPQDPRPHLALGNNAHAAGERVAAARHYRDGLARAPNDPVLGNNLASVLGELGCRDEARVAIDAAQRHLDADSRWREQLAATRAELMAGKQRRSAVCDSLR